MGSHFQQRAEDHSWFKRWWNRLTPWAQISGFIILCGFYGGTYFTQFQAYGRNIDTHEARLAALEGKESTRDLQIQLVSQKLDDLLEYWKVPRRDR